MRTISLGLALTAALIVTGCGGGGSTPAAPSSSGTGSGSTTMSETAVSTTNAVGTPMNSLSDYNNASSSLQSVARSTQSITLNTCETTSSGGSYEFFAPDKNGDPNSTEQQYFYDSACSSLARDIVRIWTSTGTSSETVNRTAKIYAAGNGTSIATRTDAETLRNATFDQYGFAIPADGFARSNAGTLQYSGTNAVASDDELVMSALSGAGESFCGDSAIGSFSIGVGTQNTACPITTPMFTLAGGTSLGSYNIPTTATYKSGLLIGLTIANATLANGTTLNVTTNTGVSPMSDLFITGVISSAGASVATFTVNAFGDGTLTMSAGGTQYVITDWHVVK